MCLLVPVRSSAGLIAASAQHGFRTRARRACSDAWFGARGPRQLAACKTLERQARFAKASRSARARHLPRSRDKPRSAPSNASGEAPLLRIMRKESIPSLSRVKSGAARGARGSPEAQYAVTSPPIAPRARRYCYLRPCDERGRHAGQGQRQPSEDGQ